MNLKQAYRKAIELESRLCTDAYYNLGSLLYSELGRLDEVVVNYKKAITLKPRLCTVVY